MQTIELIGAENVSSAGRTIARAAEEMRSAADSMSEAARRTDATLQQHQQFMDDWLERYRQLLRDHRDGRL